MWTLFLVLLSVGFLAFAACCLWLLWVRYHWVFDDADFDP